MPRIRFGRLGFIIVRFVVSLGLAAALVPAVDTRLAPPPTVWAAGYTVNAVTDPGDGTCDGTCTLRDAILAANASGGADTITFSAGGTILLDSALPMITGPLTIDGSAVSVAVDGAHAFQVFNATAPLTLTALTVQHGSAAADGGGGAKFGAAGTVSGTTFSGNSANLGGGAYFASTAVVINTIFVSNTATGDGGGGYFFDAASVTGTTFIRNTGYVGAGANFNFTAAVTNTTFSGNKAGLNGGGATFNNAVIIGTTFISNTSDLLGGGATIGGTAMVSASTFISNTAANDGGGIYLMPSTQASFDNNIIAANRVLTTSGASEITTFGTSTSLTGRHNTLAAATAGSGLAVRVGTVTAGATFFLTNTIFAGYAIGIQAGPFTPTIKLDGVLWSGVTTPTQGAGITVTNAYTGLAAFVNAAAHDFHLTGSSAARDVGVATSLHVDFEGEPRPIGPAPDLGADEYKALAPEPPIAVDDTAATPEDTPIVLNVLANDSDANADTLSVVLVTSPGSGSAAISGTTQVVYTPTLSNLGPVVFSYTISDGVFTDTAQITVTVTAQLFLPIVMR